MNYNGLMQKVDSLSQEERNHFLLTSLCFGDVLTVELAILIGGNIKMYSNYPLKRAIEKNWPSVVQLLIDEGIDVTEDNNSALKLAQKHHREEIISILKKAISNVE